VHGPVHNPNEESVGDLAARLIEDGRAYARAEIALYKEIARHRTEKAKTGLVALVGGGVFLWFAFTALVVGCVLALATLIGPLLAGIAVAAILGGLGYVGIRYGISRLSALSGDEEEKAALERGGEK
jgi:hypothetical protein